MPPDGRREAERRRSHEKFHGTTILAVRRDGKVAMGGDGQVTLGNTIMKGKARKVRKIQDGKVLVGFAGATADAFTLFERFEGKLKEFGGDLTRAAVELAKDWRTDRILRRLEAMLLVADRGATLLISGTGDVIDPEEGVDRHRFRRLLRLRGRPGLPGRLGPAGPGDRAPRAGYRGRNLYLYQPRVCYRGAGMKDDRGTPGDLTPRQIVAELDRYIIGQDKAKRAVAIALRNRTRRQRLPEELRDEVAPKNIIMIGPTGVGKTEIARRLSKLCGAPFIKVEATKYTEVGYVGRDVESMVRDLISVAISMVKAEVQVNVRAEAEKRAEEQLLDLLLPGSRPEDAGTPAGVRRPGGRRRRRGSARTAGAVLGADRLRPASAGAAHRAGQGNAREDAREAAGGGTGREDGRGEHHGEVGDAGHRDLLRLRPGGDGRQPRQPRRPGQPVRRAQEAKKVTVKQAREILLTEEMDRLVDMEHVSEAAIERVEQMGIIFIDEIDKIASKENRGGLDVSREGVQRDILPIVEGSKVNTRHGMVDTRHILFIAAGAFHMSKPSDLIPELQGRFPLRVELQALTAEDFRRILTQPRNALITQYVELLRTEGVELVFDEEAIARISEIASEVNSSTENIGARRLHTIMELLLEEVSFHASEISGQTIHVTRQYVDERLKGIIEDRDMTRFIL